MRSQATCAHRPVQGHHATQERFRSQAPWCGHCKRLAPVWDQLAERDLDGVRVCRLDMTTSEARASTIKERFAIRAFPTLLYFPPASEKIYKYSGKRELEPLATYASGGWKETEAFDPSKEPPPPPPQSYSQFLWSLLSRHRLLFGIMGTSMVIGIGVLLCAKPRECLAPRCCSAAAPPLEHGWLYY